VLPEGIEAGLVGALAVALVFLLWDLSQGEAMRTPSRLGSLLVLGSDALRAHDPVEGAAALYHAVHVAAWVALGFAGSALMGYAERRRSRWLPPLGALLAIAPLAALDAWVRSAQLEHLHLWVGGLVGILAMGAFLAWRHPGAVRRNAD
jgi:hypothetical protein